MGAVEIVEMAYQGRDTRLDGEGFQHVLPHEFGEVAHRFHRHGLVEEIERLLVLDAEAAPPGRAVGREGVMRLHAGNPAQALAQLADIGPEA